MEKYVNIIFYRHVVFNLFITPEMSLKLYTNAKILKKIANNTIKYLKIFRGGLTAAKNEPRNRGTKNRGTGMFS